VPQTGGGTIDRIMLPIGRDDYAAYPTKTLAGTPTVYCSSGCSAADHHLAAGAQRPANVITYDMLRMSQDAAVSMGQTPDAPNRFLDALCGKLAFRLGRKFWSDLVRAGKMTEQAALKMLGDLKEEAEEAWQIAALDDQEMAPLIMSLDLSSYYSPR